MTIALLDTGIDGTHPALRNSLLEGIDILDPNGRAVARANPDDADARRTSCDADGRAARRARPRSAASRPERQLLPIRIAGWQPSAEGGYAIYGRTDQLLAGLERAVDPDADGSSLDAVRVAVIGVAEPFAAFSAGPVARAVAGAAVLDTLVVAPAGNDGPAGPGYGSVAGPGGAPTALTVGAADERPMTPTARVVVRAGLRVLLDRELPLGGAVAPEETLSLEVVRPAAEARSGSRVDPLSRFFDRRRLQRRGGPRGAARANRGADRRRPASRDRRRGRRPRRRPCSGGCARPRRATRRSGDRPSARESRARLERLWRAGSASPSRSERSSRDRTRARARWRRSLRAGSRSAAGSSRSSWRPE